MKDAECVAFLQWALPRLHLRWAGFRRVRKQVCKRVERRMKELGLPDPDSYRSYLEAHADEWEVLDSFCRIPISRFYRDRNVFEYLGQSVLPSLAELVSRRREQELLCWCAGCASGEEPYTLASLWNLELASRFPTLRMRVIATDVDEHLLERARRASYPRSSIRHVPEAWLRAAFEQRQGDYFVRESFRRGVEFRRQDIRTESPEESFCLLLCRNLVFTYFDEEMQKSLLLSMLGKLASGGALVVGRGESFPADAPVDLWDPDLGVYRKP
jgi:chemotaxis protein methyltransferase CheR